MPIDKHTLQALRPIIDRALAEIGAAHGLKLKLGNGTYDPTLGSFSFKLNGADATGEAPEVLALKKYGGMYQIDMTWLDRDLISRGTAYRMIGLKLGRGDPKVLAKTSNGKVYQFPISAFRLKGAFSGIQEVALEDVLGPEER